MLLTAIALCIALAAAAVGLWVLLAQSPILTLGDPIRPDSDEDVSKEALEAYNTAVASALNGQTLATFVRRRLIWSALGFLLFLLSIGMFTGLALLLQERAGS